MPPTPGLGGALGRRPDFTSRAAVYAIRTYGGKGGAFRKGRPYPNRHATVQIRLLNPRSVELSLAASFPT